MGSVGQETPDPQPYEVLSKYMKHANPEEEFWWTHAGKTFSEMVQWTRATTSKQYEYLQFFHDHVVPCFASYRPFPGPQRQWNSGITASGLPLEYSVNWRHGSAEAMLRVGVEPISPFAGTARDPYNHVHMWNTLNRLSELQSLPSFDLELWRHFSSALCTSRSEEAWVDKNRPATPGLSIAKMQHTMGFDLCDDEVIVKIYLMPNMKARAQGTSLGRLFTDSVHAIYRDTIDHGTLDTVIDYLERTGNFNDATLFSFDCIDKARSRIKLYGCDFNTSWSRVEDLWTLGGRYANDPVTRKGLDYLHQLWDLLPIEAFQTHPDASVTNPPMLWAYEIRPGDKTPSPRLYIPGHCLHDKTVADGLTQFFRLVGWTELADCYTERLFATFPKQNPQDSTALHTWIAFSYTEKVGVYMSCYYLGSASFPF